MRFLTKFTALMITTAVLAACGQNFETDSSRANEDTLPSSLSLPNRVDNLVQSRMIDRSVLFAEVILRYDDVEETVTASQRAGTDVWGASFRLPSGRDYSLDITWYDTADGARLDLVSFNRDFSAVFDSGPVSFDFSDYDFDGYDDDSDGFTNLAEREAGTSPMTADGMLGCPVIPEAQSNVNDEPILFYANPVRFTDSFETGLPRYSFQNRNLGDEGDGLFFESEGSVRLSVSGLAGEDNSSNVNISPTLSNDPDSIFVRVQVLPDTTAVDRSIDGADARFRIEGRFFNSIADGGVDDPDADSRTGDIDLSIRLRSYQDGENFSEFLHCATVRNSDGSAGFFIDVTEDGDQDGCRRIEVLPENVEVGREYLIGMGVDRQSQTIFFQIDDERVEVPSTLPMFRAAEPYLSAGVSARGEGVVSSARVSEITVNGVTDDRLVDLNPAIATRYDNINRHLREPNRTVSSENGVLKLEGVSDDDGSAIRTDLFIAGDTNHIAADLRLSSETMVTSEDGFASVRITGAQYNDLANGGINGNEGDHWASLGIGVQSSGEKFASACLIRSQTSDYESTCFVTETPENACPRFSTPIEFDTDYQASITFDRANKKLIYQLNDEQIVHDVTTNVFLPAGGRKATNTRISGRGRIVGFVDNLSTIPPESGAAETPTDTNPTVVEAEIPTAVMRPTITGHVFDQGPPQVLTVNFSIDMTERFFTQGEYIPSRSFWPNPRTFVVEFESVQSGGSIRLIPESFISVSGETLEEGLEVTFP